MMKKKCEQRSEEGEGNCHLDEKRENTFSLTSKKGGIYLGKHVQKKGTDVFLLHGEQRKLRSNHIQETKERSTSVADRFGKGVRKIDP